MESGSQDILPAEIANVVDKRKSLQSQNSTIELKRSQAVCVRRAHKSYGRKTNKNVVLDGLNMTVPKNTM